MRNAFTRRRRGQGRTASPFPIPHSPFQISLRPCRGFTLLELLVVVAIIMLLASLLVPAFNGIGRASNLTNASRMVGDSLEAARLTAMAENRVVEVRFYKLPDELGSLKFRAMQSYRYNAAMQGEPVPVSKLVRLPTAVIMVEKDEFSTLLSADNTRGGMQVLPGSGLNAAYKAVRFTPVGSTDLHPTGTGAGDRWFVTFLGENSPPASGAATLPADNFATLVVEPVSGRTTTYRP